MKSVSDEALIASYKRTKSVWKTGKEVGLCGQTVHERLKKFGIVEPVNVFTEADKQRLIEDYGNYKRLGKLQDLADDMGRTKQFICRKARSLGLTSRSHAAPWSGKWKYMPDEEYMALLDQLLKYDGTLTEFMEERGFGVQFELTAKQRFPAEWEAISELKMGGNPRYRRGRDFEYSTKRKLESRGYVVMRSPASKTPADLWAVKAGKIYFVQCKLSGEFGSVAEWNTFLDYAASAGAVPLLANRPKGGRGVEFWLITGKKDGSRKPQPKIPYDV